MHDNINLSASGVKLGIIGTNFISDSLVDAAKKTGLPVKAVYSRKQETGKAFAQKHGIEKVFCDFGEFLAYDGINAVYVASPNFCHCQQTLSALESSKHVLCEKPAASKLADFCKMTERAKTKGLVVIEAMRPAFDPALEKIKELLSLCGKLRYAHFEYSQYSSRYDKFKEGVVLNAFNPEFSNAAIMDIGVYPIHICAALFGKPSQIISRSVMLENGFEGQGNALLSYGDMTAEIVYSKITEAASPSFIRGEKGEIRFGTALSKINEMTFVPRKGKPENIDLSPVDNNMIFELCAFCDFVSGKRDACDHNRNTETALFIMDEIRAQNGIVFPEDKM